MGDLVHLHSVIKSSDQPPENSSLHLDESATFVMKSANG